MTTQAADYGPEALAARAEIADVIHRYCHATDRRRWWLMDTVFHEDATCHLSVIGGSWREFVKQGAALLEPVGVTHHQVGNIQIALEGDVAHAETYVTAFHRVPADAPPGGPFGGTGEAYDAVFGARYVDRFERRGGVWRIAERRSAAEFRHYQPVNEGGLADVPMEHRGLWGDDDVSLPVVAAWRGDAAAQDARTLDLLAARAEIADVVNRFCHMVDRHRWELIDDVFHADGASRFLDAVRTIPQMEQSGRTTLGPLSATHHQTGNMLIRVEGDTAWAETYVIAFHAVPTSAPAGGFWGGRDAPYEGVAGGRYVDRLERRDGRWKIAERQTLVEWRHDRPVRDGGLGQVPAQFRGQRGDADVSRPVVAALLDRR
ncbi:MAG: nuclear transport factor 2 family protein [Phenylobacterium sp.]|uniref:nuclear transport factor 2 family protein n=1 Tax=Phenylobacterium sp. TaxID=1871053 RepID=UPI001A52962C|nr:nuclear transport factor 2 family protein [Phenylobacterium sp.]MBL8554849.1 nuclear transport factor 2 family protein [Phenylobacterium sp.]